MCASVSTAHVYDDAPTHFPLLFSPEGVVTQVLKHFPNDNSDDALCREVPKFCFAFVGDQYRLQGREYATRGRDTFEMCNDMTHFVCDCSQTYTFVLTDGEGWQQLGYCRFTQMDDARLQAICFVSYLPWFHFFDEVLDALVRRVRQKQVPFISSLSLPLSLSRFY